MSWTGVALFVAPLIFLGACKKEPVAAPPANVKDNASVTNAVVATPNLVFTLAGDTTNGFVDGTGANARFNEVAGIAIDSSGNLIVADAFNRAIRKVTPTGVVTTIAGKIDNSGFIATDGSLSEARFGIPGGIAIDGSGTIYITDGGSERVRFISGDQVGTAAGGFGDVRGEIQGDFKDGPGSVARFNEPQGIVSNEIGNLFVADLGNGRIRAVVNGHENGFFVNTFAGSGIGLDIDGPPSGAGFSGPHGLARDASGNLYVADQFGNTIRKIDPSGNVTTLAGSSERGFVNGVGRSARFNNPTGVAVDRNGNVYVSDFGNFAVRKITPAGVVTTLAGNGVRGTADGTAANAQFIELDGIAVDPSGAVYVADHDRIRVILHPKVTPPPPVTM